MADELQVTPHLIIPPKDLVWTAVRSSGAGGQNVNKVASKVELRFDLAHSAVLCPDVRGRLRATPGLRIDADGWMIVVSQRSRDQSQNLADARERLRQLVLAALIPPKPRRPTKPTRSAKRRRVDDKKAQGQKKADRRWRD